MSTRGSVTAVLGKGLAQQLGKKGTESDLTLYNFRMQDTVLSFVEPSTYPERIQSLVSSLNIADQALLKVDALDSALAESVVALDMAGLSKGYIIYGGSVSPEDVKPILAGTVVGSYAVVEDQSMAVKERLASIDLKSEGPVVVQVDHSFPVKGVGTVALGVVKGGVMKRHDSLTIFPSLKTALIKSIQVNDVDVESAGTGLRVGFALKDLKPDEVTRGCLLSSDESLTLSKEFELEASLSRYSKKPLGVGDQFTVNSCLNYVPAKVVSGSVSPGGSGRLKLSLEREVPVLGGRVVFLDPGLKPPRVFGYGTV